MATISTTARPAYVYDAVGDQWVPIAWRVLPAGVGSAPALTFTGDSNTGLWSPAADTVAFSTGGVERLRIGSTGNVGIGTSSPSVAFHVSGQALVSANASGNAFEIRQTGSGNALVVEDATNPDATPFVVDTVGRVLRGTTTPIVGSITPDMQSAGADSGQAGFGLYGFNAANSGPQIEMGLSANASVGSHTVVNSGDAFGTIRFSGSDGTNFIRGAQIVAAVDGTPGTNDMPGRLTFSTTADGASSPTERMRITSAGNVGIGTTSPNALLHAVGAAAGSPSVIVSAGGNVADDGGQIDFRVNNNPSYGSMSAIKGILANMGPEQQGGIAFLTRPVSAGSVSLAERMRITSAGNVGIGTSSPGHQLHIVNSASYTPIVAVENTTADGGSSVLRMRKSRSNGIVSSGDELGWIQFQGHDSTAFKTAASIYGFVDGTPGTNDMPGRLAFYTCPDGTTTLTERMRIDNAGLVTGTGTSLGAWTAYTPTLTASTTNPTLGTGSTASGSYMQIGKVCIFRVRIVFGTSGVAAGSGTYRISLPVAGVTLQFPRPLVNVLIRDVSTGDMWFGLGLYNSTTDVSLRVQTNSSGTAWVTDSAPYAWAASDEIWAFGTYEIA